MDPIPFVTTGEDGTGLSVNGAASDLLRGIRKPLVVVSVVGMYRTGKSFLLNRLMGRTDGFPLGATVEAKTKGIWMWVGDFPGDSSKAMVLLDTEGLHDPEKGSRTHDVQIFTLSVLLSSVLIYNSKGSIDSTALDGLHLATELTDHISMKASGDNEETGEAFSKVFPMLIWAVRDHHLELSKDGQPITADQYLENCLALKRGRGKDITSYNSLRETIRAFFKIRHCFVFPLPTAMENLKNLETMRLDQLDPKFIEAGDQFTQFVLNTGLCKMVKGKEITGGMFATLSENYVEAIVNGAVNIESAYDYMIQSENTKAIEKAISFYQKEMKSLPFPVSMDVLNQKNHVGQAGATEIFLQTAVNNERNMEYFNRLNGDLEDMYQAFVFSNMEDSTKKCQDILKKLYTELGAREAQGEFTRPGGHKVFKDLVDAMENKFEEVPEEEKGPCGQKTLLSFRTESIEPKLAAILQTDEALSAEERKQELLKNEIEDKERMKVLLQEKNTTLQKQQEEMKESYESNYLKQKEEFQRQHQQDISNLESNMANAMEEKERLLKEGFKEHADLMKDELREAKEEIETKEAERIAFQEKMAKEMEEKMKTMKEEEEGRVKKMKEMQEQVANSKGGGGGLFSSLGMVLDNIMPIGFGKLKKFI